MDKSGEVIVIHEKLPVLGVDGDAMELNLPMKVTMECAITFSSKDALQIDTSQPHGICDIEDRTRFEVSAELVMR